MADETRVLIFGDQTCDVNAKLRQLLLVQSNPILTTFFGQAFYVIRTELGYLPVAEQKTFPKFNSIADLLSRQRRDGVNQALQTALSCIYQLGHFIWLAEILSYARGYYPLTDSISSEAAMARSAARILRNQIPTSLGFAREHSLPPP